jgi:predicted Zn-dependent peptidase
MIDIGIATALPFTTENNIAFLAAALQLHQTLSGKMAENGFYVEMTPNLKLYPMESVELIFNCQPVPECGLPFGVDSGSENPMRAVNVAKKVISDVLAKPITDGELKAYKTLLSNRYSASIAVPSRFIDAILLRYAYGKDILTDYGNRINGITAERVNQVKNALLEGMRIEYVVK